MLECVLNKDFDKLNVLFADVGFHSHLVALSNLAESLVLVAVIVDLLNLVSQDWQSHRLNYPLSK